MAILITGGAGYIGSHVLRQLLETTKEDIIVIDNLSTGNKETINKLKKIRNFKFYEKDLRYKYDIKILEDNTRYSNITAVFHFAGSLLVEESVSKPLEYYENNVISTINLLKFMENNNINNLVFSSTAAVYGNGNDNPINPYGHSKKMIEQIIQDYSKANSKFNYTILRYFNVAGASLDSLIGQVSKTSTHLIKIASETATNKRDKMYIFGTDYNTKDGTCIRDYIHILDLADIHIKALEYMINSKESNIFNAGYGYGYSVKEVIETIKKISYNFNVEYSDRRVGDPDTLISDISLLKEKLKWKPKYNNLETICKTALEWEKMI